MVLTVAFIMMAIGFGSCCHHVTHRYENHEPGILKRFDAWTMTPKGLCWVVGVLALFSLTMGLLK